MWVEQLGKTIRERRKVWGITQPHLPGRGWHGYKSLYKPERGQAKPSWEVAGKLAEVPGLEVAVQGKQSQSCEQQRFTATNALIFFPTATPT